MTRTTQSAPRRPHLNPWARTGLRLLLIGLVALAVHALLSVSMDLADRLPEAERNMMTLGLLVAALLAYTLLIAVPFVPGIEIGLALLVLRGASIAPAVYTATVLGLLIAFFVGRLVPERALARFFLDLRMRRAGRLVLRAARLSDQERHSALERRLPRWLSLPLTRYRYLSLVCLLNLPGNVVMGGGGGLLMLAGLSRLYRPGPTVLTLFLAVLPVPLTVWWVGIDAMPHLR